jgi:hypothetical protein
MEDKLRRDACLIFACIVFIAFISATNLNSASADSRELMEVCSYEGDVVSETPVSVGEMLYSEGKCCSPDPNFYCEKSLTFNYYYEKYFVNEIFVVIKEPGSEKIWRRFKIKLNANQQGTLRTLLKQDELNIMVTGSYGKIIVQKINKESEL